MKKYTFSLILMIALFFVQTNAQVSTPAPSPLCKIVQKVGLSDVTIEYSKPGMKDRTIFGDLVPFGEMWRTGANASTKLEFSQDIKMGGTDVPKGKYALYTIPGVDNWTIILHKNTKHGGTGGKDYRESEDLVRFSVKSQKTSMACESFTIFVNNLRNGSASIDLWWENTLVSIPFSLNTTSEVNKSIEKTLAGPTGSDYYRAASYYLDEKIDLAQAYVWVKKAREVEGDKFWMVRKQSLIEAEMGDLKSAIASAQESKKLAQAAGNMDYVRMNEKAIAEWSAK